MFELRAQDATRSEAEFRPRDCGADIIDLVADRDWAVEWNVQNASPSLMHVRTSL